tara:strand:+ start:1213 stop:1938 length:726 start_codon:yes stop_codon:yes gene_type:complete
MAYFRHLPNIAYQSPLSHKNRSDDYIVIKNIFRRTKLFDFLSSNVSVFQKFVIGDGARPDTVAEDLYGDSSLDFVVILTAGITNINHQWPIQDYQVYDFALEKYGSEAEMTSIHHYETLEIVDDKGRLILPPELIVDGDFKISGTVNKYPSTRYTLKSLTGNRQLDDKDEFSVTTDNIASPVTNLEFEYKENEKRREIDVLRNSYVNMFVEDMKDIVRYDRSSSYITSNLAITPNTEKSNP